MSLWTPLLAALPTAVHMRAHLVARNPAILPRFPARVAILGAAEEGRRLAETCAARGIAVASIVDDDPARLGRRVAGATVMSFASLASLDRSTPVVVASHRLLGAVRRLRAMGFVSVCGSAALQVADPIGFPPHMFYADWFEDLERHRMQYAQLAERLADDRSRAVLDALIGFRLTLDPEVLAPVLDADLYGAKDLPPPPDPSVYVDAGTFDGDSIRLYLDRYGTRCRTVHGFEPDPTTFQRLKENFADDPRIVPHNAGLSSGRGKLTFAADASRASILSPDGGVSVVVVGLDEVLAGAPAGVIKMNIEGAEIDALEGAARTIARYKPTLMISAYHRPSDLWRLPETIDRLAPGYRFYLRQHDGGVIESVLYALPTD